MSSPAPRNVPLDFTIAYTQSGAPMTGAETVLVRSVIRGSDDSTVSGVAGAALTFVENGTWQYRLAASENDRYRESYTLVTEMTTGSPDRAWQWAKVRVDQGLFDARRQLPASASTDRRGGPIDAYLWHTWGGSEANGGLIDIGRDLTGFDNIILSVKDDEDDADADAILQVEFPVVDGGNGLVTLNAAAASNTDGSIVLTGDGCGIIWTVVSSAIQAVSAALSARVACYQVTGVVDSPASREVLVGGIFTVKKGNARA